MGGASISIEDVWAVFNNPAGINQVKSETALFSYRNRYSISQLSSIGAAYIQPLQFGHVGLNAFRFGDDLFSEQKAGIVFSDRMGIVALGGGVNYVQFNIEGLGSRGFLTLDFGGIVSFQDRFFIGAHISNINQGKVSKSEGEKLPTIMRIGFSYRPISGLLMNVEVEKDLDFDEILKLGIEYNFYKQFFARTGILTEPFQARFGLGFRPKKFLIDYAYGSDPRLGNIHEISVGYLFRKNS